MLLSGLRTPLLKGASAAPTNGIHERNQGVSLALNLLHIPLVAIKLVLRPRDSCTHVIPVAESLSSHAQLQSTMTLSLAAAQAVQGGVPWSALDTWRCHLASALCLGRVEQQQRSRDFSSGDSNGGAHISNLETLPQLGVSSRMLHDELGEIRTKWRMQCTAWCSSLLPARR